MYVVTDKINEENKLTIYGTNIVLSMSVCQSHVTQSHLFMFYIQLKGRMGNLGSL